MPVAVLKVSLLSFPSVLSGGRRRYPERQIRQDDSRKSRESWLQKIDLRCSANLLMLIQSTQTRTVQPHIAPHGM